MDRVRGIMGSLGHHLEEEIASKELWLELSQKLRTGDKLYNETNRRKLSEARVLDRESRMRLRDEHIEKDEKKKN